jgi:hypothetical protein
MIHLNFTPFTLQNPGKKYGKVKRKTKKLFLIKLPETYEAYSVDHNNCQVEK